VRAWSRREAQGSNEPDHRFSMMVEQRTLGLDTPEVEATFEERPGFGQSAGRKRANHERGRTHGERTSNGPVTVSTLSGGESSEGSGAREECRTTAETSTVGMKPGEPHGR